MRQGLVTDADNTLWDTDGVYAEAQLWLVQIVEGQLKTNMGRDDRLTFIREVDQLIAQRHHAGLRYPSVLLVSALRKVMAGTALNRAVNEALHETRRNKADEQTAIQFDEALKKTPPLREGVKSALEQISDLGVPGLVATEGSSERCQSRLDHWGLGPAIKHLLSAPKSRAFFERAAKLLHTSPSNCFVVGDQLDRDISFAALAGCKTIYFPGGFSPVWAPTVEAVSPTYIVKSFEEVVTILRNSVDTAEARTRSA